MTHRCDCPFCQRPVIVPDLSREEFDDAVAWAHRLREAGVHWRAVARLLDDTKHWKWVVRRLRYEIDLRRFGPARKRTFNRRQEARNKQREPDNLHD